MGSKRELLDKIRAIVIEQDIAPDKALLDLFAGTCGVGMSVRDIMPVYSNDIQKYSSYIADGCLGTEAFNLDKEEALRIIAKRYKENYEALKELVPNARATSNAYIATQVWNDEKRVEYIAFAEQFESKVLGLRVDNIELKKLKAEYAKRQSNPKLFPYMQTTFLFSEMYFSIDQCMAIDSLVYAIDNLTKEKQKYNKLLFSALIHTYSYSSAGTGHFAQFRDLSTMSSIKDVFLYRGRSVLDYFFRKAEEIAKMSVKNKYPDLSKSFSLDYVDLMSDKKIMKNVGIVYADPPYSFVHYSRFYHAIEDLCRYDYPDVEHKGRYRKDRHQSPFCIKSKAPYAFDVMFKKASEYKLPLLVSYSNTGMITLETLDHIAKSNGYKVVALEIDHKHSTMGRLKDKHRNVKEALLLCTLD
jgi:adenine-specific DNA-methyltransferase